MASAMREGKGNGPWFLAWLPRSVTARALLVVALGAVFIACVGSALMMMLNTSFARAIPSIVAIIGLSLFAGSLLLWALRRLLAPIRELERALEYYREHGVEPQPGRDQRGKLLNILDGLLSNVQDELRQSRTAADTDPLTGLLNRRGFDRHRQPNEKGSIIFVDLDNFKLVNDALGHDAGDLVLAATADLMRSVLRQGELVARFGGEEFVVFLPEIDLETAALVAERIRSTAERNLSTPLGRVTISAGVAELAPGESFSEALVRADRAVYAAKAHGRNYVQVVEKNTLTEVTRHPSSPATAAE